MLPGYQTESSRRCSYLGRSPSTPSGVRAKDALLIGVVDAPGPSPPPRITGSTNPPGFGLYRLIVAEVRHTTFGYLVPRVSKEDWA